MYILEIAYYVDIPMYIKRQQEYPGPDSLWPGQNIKSTSEDADTISIRRNWCSK